jgi:1-acyl-sn-glycerol-3-phosphate acyltransferase
MPWDAREPRASDLPASEDEVASAQARGFYRWELILRSLLFALLMVPSTVVFGAASLFTFPFPFEVRYRFITGWTRLNLWWLKKTCRLDHRIHGLENLPSRNAVILCKHQSAWETMALQSIFPPQVYVLKRELLWIPFFGWGLSLLDPIAIDRKAGRKALQQLLVQGTQRLKAGRWVVVYPEGTRVQPGQKGTYSIGGAWLAAHSGYPVVPVAHNAGEFWPKRSFIKYPGIIDVVIGPPIASEGRKAGEINTRAEQWIEQTVARISRAEREKGEVQAESSEALQERRKA